MTQIALLPLQGRIALVTGSSRGIGLAIARRLFSLGASVATHGLGPSTAPPTPSTRAAGEMRYYDRNLNNPSEVASLIEDVEKEIGEIDILVNNAGMQYVAPLEEFPLAKWEEILSLNLTTAFLTTQQVLPGMRAKNWGRIINIASVSGLIGVANKSAYVASKHGLVGLTKSIALETSTTAITCNALCPGWVLTPLVESQIEQRASTEGLDFEEAKRELVSTKQPSGKYVTTDQVAGLASFLCSPEADEVRGVAWNIDGGYVAG